MYILVIVESPAKCGIIEKYLGPGYKCMASFGHLRTIASLKDIDIENGFQPTYSIISDVYKPKQIEKLRIEIESASEVILACDADREGEAIAFSICEIFGLDPSTTERILFHEITESAIQHAIRNPTRINMNIVQAQQARQVLDLLVGFTVTPHLWKSISKTYEYGMSAGRCQTPALRLIYENYIENTQYTNKKVYSIAGSFFNQSIIFKLKEDIAEESEVVSFLASSKEHEHIFSRSVPVQKIKKAPLPFTTSTLQQTASNEYNYSPKETMKCCQELYEAGYITYMRTDCASYSGPFLSTLTAYISSHYGSEFVSQTIQPSASNLPHEAIRPTSLLTKKVEESMSAKATKMYTLIWRRTVESGMFDAIAMSVTAEITAPISKYVYVSEQFLFEGWRKVKPPAKESSNYDYLMSIKEGIPIPFKKITAEIIFQSSKGHYTEAYLVQLLEKRGIGRPSTFSSIVDKNQERKYVIKQHIEGKKVECREYLLESASDDIRQTIVEREFGAEKNKLVIQPIGITVVEFLLEHFGPLFEYSYTEKMEELLDLIANGTVNWSNVCGQCYAEITKLCNSIQPATKYNIRIDDHHEYIIGKNGPVIKYTSDDGKVSFKVAKKDVDMSVPRTLEEVVEKSTNKKLGIYQNEDLVIRRGKFGLYITWGSNSKSMQCFGNRPIENITYAEVFEILEKDGILNPKVSVGFVREVSKNVSIRHGKFGDYIYYKTNKMKTPKFLKLTGFKEDYRNCQKHILQEWIKTTHNVE